MIGDRGTSELMVEPFDSAYLADFVRTHFEAYIAHHDEAAEGKGVDLLLASGLRLTAEAFQSWGVDNTSDEPLWRAATFGAVQIAEQYEEMLSSAKSEDSIFIARNIRNQARRLIIHNHGHEGEALGALYIADVVENMAPWSLLQPDKAVFMAKARALYVGYTWQDVRGWRDL